MDAQTDRLYQDVHFLTSLRPFRNWTQLAVLRDAYQYIMGELEAAGYTV